MPSGNDSLVARVQSSYRKLSEVASELNTVSDSLGNIIADLDLALKKLNLGITVWVKLRGDDDPETYDHWREEIGYAKIGGKWGVALQTVTGNYQHPDRDYVEKWLFNDAPRQLRLSSLVYIPELLEKLSEHAANATKQIAEKLQTTHELVNAIKEAAADSRNSAQPTIRLRPTTARHK
jgi:superfamily II DNA/RNA helicase